jgi:saccharopine dehydrogenase (NAD+, L-lysine forming)
VYVQPSPIRCYRDEEYVQSGAILSETLDETDTIFGLKEIPKNKFETLSENKTYLFFSHTIKGIFKLLQKHNHQQ